MRLFRKRRRHAAPKIVFGCILSLTAALMITASCLFSFGDWHELDPELILGCNQSLRVYDRNGTEISVIGKEKRIWVGIDELNKHTVDAFVSAEDARFYTHKGVDIYRIFGAAWADIKAGSYVQGASTISQQLIKLSHLSTEKTLDRKLEEAVLAYQLENAFDKDEIMEMYLNYIYFGGGYYGIETASLGYFGVHARELTAAQSALLAGILKSPSAYAPHLDAEASLKRRNNILRLMKEYGYLNEEEYGAAVNEALVLNNALPSLRNEITDYAIKEAEELTHISYDELCSGGYSIYLSMDSEINDYCSSLFTNSELFPSDNAEAALVLLDSSGGILAMVGGRSGYSPASLNRAVDIERQPGSLIKPVLVYAPALERFGYSAASVFNDEQKSFGDYSPRNSDDKYYGTVLMRTAISKSLNIPAVESLSDIGVYQAVMFAQKMGVSFENEQLGLPLALGGFTHGVSPLEMAEAYSIFANGGLKFKPTSIERIVDGKGKVIYEKRLSGERLLSQENSFILTSMLESAAREGTAKRLSETNLPIAAKTGTSVDENGVRDAWCAAYTSDYTAVIWMGTDSADKGSLPKEAVGGNHTAIILGRLFEKLYENRACDGFETPSGVESVRIDISCIDEGTVYKASANTPEEYVIEEYFVKGEAPDSLNPYWEAPDPPSELGWSIADKGYPVISFVSESEIFTYRILRSSASEGEKEVCAFSGKKGYLSFTDTNVVRGAAYVYIIIAEHPVLKDENNEPLRSEPSRKLNIIVPFYY